MKNREEFTPLLCLIALIFTAHCNIIVIPIILINHLVNRKKYPAVWKVTTNTKSTSNNDNDNDRRQSFNMIPSIKFCYSQMYIKSDQQPTTLTTLTHTYTKFGFIGHIYTCAYFCVFSNLYTAQAHPISSLSNCHIDTSEIPLVLRTWYYIYVYMWKSYNNNNNNAHPEPTGCPFGLR